jgi:hypothetical protein
MRKLVIICSRPEPIISTTFNGSLLQDISTRISLSHGTNADADIRIFLVKQFVKLKLKLPPADRRVANGR